MINEKIKEFSLNASQPLLKVSEKGAKQIYEFEIDCCNMKDYNNVNVLIDSDYSKIFDVVTKISGPFLYYFEITSTHSSKEIVDRINLYKVNENSKAVPAIKKRYPQSKVLYVGKVKKGLWGRLVQHLGYYRVKGTQGLQLFHWTEGMDISIKMNVFEFEAEMANYMEVLERQLAREIKPILGKH